MPRSKRSSMEVRHRGDRIKRHVPAEPQNATNFLEWLPYVPPVVRIDSNRNGKHWRCVKGYDVIGVRRRDFT